MLEFLSLKLSTTPEIPILQISFSSPFPLPGNWSKHIGRELSMGAGE
jgi:hypothetical protein